MTSYVISIAISPNLSSFTYTQQQVEEAGCGEVVANGEEVMSWSSTLGAYLLSSNVTSEAGAVITGWTPASGDIIATKDMILRTSDNTSSSRGNAYFVLFHAPE